MTENIELNGDNILDGYQDENNEFSETEESVDEEPKKQVVIKLPEPKGPEFYRIYAKINEFKRVFPQECGHIDVDEDKITLQDLHLKFEECKQCSANREGNKMHRLGFKAMLQVSELHVAPKLGMDLRGFANTATSDEEILKTLDEIAILQDWGAYISPEKRLLFGLGTLALRVNAKNKAEEKEKKLKLPENKENYDDL